MAKYNLESEKTTKFFCKLNMKVKSTAQFDKLIVKEENPDGQVRERTITDQKSLEWEVRKYYWKLYGKQKVVIDKEEVKNMTGNIKKISQLEKDKLHEKNTMTEVITCLQNTRNNVAPGCGGFSGTFYKVFWCYIKNVVLGAIHQIYEDKTLPVTLRLEVIALILKGSKDKRYIANWRPFTLLETLYKLLLLNLAL